MNNFYSEENDDYATWRNVCPRCRRYPETVVEEAVDDGVDKAVAHRQPVNSRVDGDDDAARLRLILVAQLRYKVENDVEAVQRQPAQSEQRHDDHQHLDHL